MSAQSVVYEMSLRDGFSPVMAEAEKKAVSFEGHLDKITEIAKGMGEAIAVSFGIFKSIDFFKDSVKEFDDAAQSMAQLEATMRSTHNVAGLNKDALEEQAAALEKVSRFSETQIIKGEALLGTFTNIRGAIYNEALPAILDLSAKMGNDLTGAVNIVGKALNDPVSELGLLKKEGITLSDSQQKLIKQLVATNQVAKAQSIILKELEMDYGGSAKAAAEAGTGPFVVFQHEIEHTKETLGEIVVEIGKDLMPTLQKLADWFKASVEWLGRNRRELESLVKILGEAFLAYKALTIAVPLLTELGIATISLTTSTEAAAFATNQLATASSGLQASLGPVIATATSLLGIYYSLKNAMIDVNDIQNGLSKNVVETLKHRISGAMKVETDIQGGSEEKAYNRLKADFEAERDEAQKTVDQWKKVNEGMGNMAGIVINHAKSFQEATAHLALANKKLEILEEQKPGSPFVAGKTNPPFSLSKPETAKATGTRAITINISIKELVHSLSINTKNLTEGVAKAKDMVANALTSAVNDSEIIAGQP